MKYTIRCAFLTSAFFVGTLGCSQSTNTVVPEAQVSSSKPQSSVATENTTAAESRSANAPSNATGAPDETGAKAIAAPTTTSAAAIPAVHTKTVVETKTAIPNMTAAAEPATASKTLAVIDLMELPRINVKSFWNDDPTNVYYSCESSLAAVDAFYKAEFESRGWSQVPSQITPTDQYIDRNFSKDGFVVRFGASIGSTRGEIALTLSNLGNIDVRQLPVMDDAEPTPSTAVSAGHKTARSIPDVAETLGKKMLDLGWQAYTEFYAPPTDVPHYRSLTFRKNAIRVNLGIVLDPRNPSEKTTVFYHAEYVIPIDIPTPDSRQTLRLDLSSSRAAFTTTASRAEMISLLAKASEQFQWTLKNAEEFEAGDAHGVLIATGPKSALMARLVETEGTMSMSFEKAAFKNETTEIETSKVAITETEPSPSQSRSTKNEIDTTVESIQSEVSKTINDELKKALGSLQGLGTARSNPLGGVDLAELQAKANALTKSFAEKDVDESPSNSTTVNPYDVPEDTEAFDAADLKIASSKCVLKHGKKTYQLNHVAAYVMMEYGQSTKCIAFAEKPLNTDKLKRMLLKGESVHAFDIRGELFTPILDIRVSGNNVSINAVVESSSIGTNASELKSTVRYRDGKLVGRVFTDKPMKLGDEDLEFHAELNQPIIQVDWASRTNPENLALVADSSKDYPVPENCTSNSMEGTKYLKNVEAVVEAPLSKVEVFYAAEFNRRGWKERPQNPGQKTRKFSDGKVEIEVELTPQSESTNIRLVVRDGVAAKADGMIPPAGKGMALLGNLSDDTIEVSVAGKIYTLNPGSGATNPKDAMRITLEPGTCKIQFKSKKSGKSVTTDANIAAGTTWGVLYDSDFQDVMRFF
ncbi:MAG: hypothetical protein ABL921_14385 [Pirellula sp.]